MSAPFEILTKDKQTYLYTQGFGDIEALEYLFEYENFPGSVVVEGVAGDEKVKAGRGNTYFLKFKELQLVLRHYCRGGFIAKLSYDLYCWSGLLNTRAYKEFDLLHQLHDLNLPVPQAYAARISRKGLFYRADLITIRLKHAKSLAQLCVSTNMTDPDWSAVGQLIKNFHNQQVYHADLNAHNILYAENKWYLIDFDKCEFRQDSKWKMDNVSRLYRSLEKLRKQQKTSVTQKNWQLLLSAYNQY